MLPTAEKVPKRKMAVSKATRMRGTKERRKEKE